MPARHASYPAVRRDGLTPSFALVSPIAFPYWRARCIARPPPVDKRSEPIQEDYGWGFWSKREKDTFWIALGLVEDSPAEGPAQWVVSLDAHRSGLASRTVPLYTEAAGKQAGDEAVAVRDRER
jgi:hypothetical protein